MGEDKKNKGKEISRREFVVGSSAVIAGGALGAVAPAAATSEPAKADYAQSTGYIVYDSRLCAGCQSFARLMKKFRCEFSHIFCINVRRIADNNIELL